MRSSCSARVTTSREASDSRRFSAWDSGRLTPGPHRSSHSCMRPKHIDSVSPVSPEARMEEVDILECESLAVCDAYDGEINILGQSVSKDKSG